MKKLLALSFLIISITAADAQDTITNGGFESWHGGFFKPGEDGCCGAALALPLGWGVPEQLMAMPSNFFVDKDYDTAYIHSGHFSARLSTTTTSIDSAGNLQSGMAVLVPGRVTCAGIVGYGGLGMTGDPYLTQAYSLGAGFADSPSILYFFMRFDHGALDTARYAYALTRWDSVNMREDTLAASDVDIPDDNVVMNQWILFSDTLHYMHSGTPDRLHLTFYGGRNADSAKAGNVTWLDDVSFDHISVTASTTGILPVPAASTISVYPNPASDLLHIATGSSAPGNLFELYDTAGALVMKQPLTGTLNSYRVTSLADGVYTYCITYPASGEMERGKVSIVR